MPKIVDAEEQRRRIRDAARRVFSRHGLAGTGLARVAAAARMGRSNLYHYYPHKNALIRDLADELLAEEEALFAGVVAGPGSPLARIEHLAAAVTELFGRWLDTGQLLLQLWANEPRRVRPFFHRIRAALTAIIREGQREGEIADRVSPGLAAGLVIGLIDGLLLQAFLDPRAFPEPAEVQSALVDAVHRMLAP